MSTDRLIISGKRGSEICEVNLDLQKLIDNHINEKDCLMSDGKIEENCIYNKLLD